MKLSAYIVKVDSGFAPNPFGRRCTLACCKPAIRRTAQPGDIIVGSGSKRVGLVGHIIYAMRVAEVLPYAEYWERYPSKRPSSTSARAKRGDNVWHRRNGEWRGVRGAAHSSVHRARDLRGVNALVAADFFYFGRDAMRVPESLRHVLATTQGHKNTTDRATIDRFWQWVSSAAPHAGRIGLPVQFADADCRLHRNDANDDDARC